MSCLIRCWEWNSSLLEEQALLTTPLVHFLCQHLQTRIELINIRFCVTTDPVKGHWEVTDPDGTVSFVKWTCCVCQIAFYVTVFMPIDHCCHQLWSEKLLFTIGSGAFRDLITAQKPGSGGLHHKAQHLRSRGRRNSESSRPAWLQSMLQVSQGYKEKQRNKC